MTMSTMIALTLSPLIILVFLSLLWSGGENGDRPTAAAQDRPPTA